MRLIKRSLFVFITWFLIHTLSIVIDGLIDDEVTAELVIVFGNKVNEDGSISPRLKARLDKSIELYNSFNIKEIFVSVGLGSEGHYEGTKMAEYLIQKGIPEEHISIDNKGNTSILTAQNTIKGILNYRR